MKVIRLIVLIPMGIVILFSLYMVYSIFFGAGRTGNYLKVRKKSDASCDFGYRILPSYRFVLKRLLFYSLIDSVFFLIMPFSFAFMISMALIIFCEWNRILRNPHCVSFITEWIALEYKLYILIIILVAGALLLTLLHFLLYPLMIRLFTVLF